MAELNILPDPGVLTKPLAMDYIGLPHHASEMLQNKFISTINLFSTKKWVNSQSHEENVWFLEWKMEAMHMPYFSYEPHIS